MRSKTRTYAKRIFLFCLLIFIAGYSYYQGRSLIAGPQINIEEPKNGTEVTETLLQIKGRAKNVSFISMDGRQIYIDNDGIFREKLLIEEGYNIIKFSATDKFGREESKILELVLKERSNPGLSLNNEKNI